VFALDYIRDRFGPALDAAAATGLNTHLGALQTAVIDGEIDAAVAAAIELRSLIAGLLGAS
jgi:hypothetical protein